MGNIRNFNFNNLDLRLNNKDYWDFYLASSKLLNETDVILTGSCFVVWYDFNNPETFSTGSTSASTIHSIVSWTGSTNTGYTFNTIGLTGIDNGLVLFERDILDPTNQALLSALTGTTLVISSGDTRLTLKQVTGTTEQYIYPIEDSNDFTGNFKQFCGGFYQGFYKIDGSDYEVLPNRFENGWTAEFWLNPNTGCTINSGNTLNDLYPNNKGFFFYLGTRAENKFWNQFYGSDTGCTSACTISDSACTGTVSTFCTIPKETDFTIIGDEGFGIPLNPPQIEMDLVTNPFLIYGRANDKRADKLTGDTGFIIASAITNTSSQNECCDLNSYDGLGTQNVYEYDGKGIWVAKKSQIKNDFRNPFLIYGRASGYPCGCINCSGSGETFGNQTVCSYSGNSIDEIRLDYNLDIIDNAIGFRIKDDGSIGYRLLTVSGECYTNTDGEKIYSSGITVQENYSVSGIVSPNTWNYIAIKFVTNYLDGCELINAKKRNGKLMFYVNGKLKFVVNDFPEFIGKRLNENRLKQVSVPFNISLGGGSQGLLESQTFDGLDIEDRGLPIEENFAGTFIGAISQFKFNICPLSYKNINNNYLNDFFRYNN